MKAKPTRTLFVCHSIGDTDIILAVARELLQQSEDPIQIFVVGQAAKQKCESLPEGDCLKTSPKSPIVYLSSLFDSQVMLDVEDSKLSEAQLHKMTSWLEEQQFTKALIGTPSKNDAMVPFQLAELLANQLTVGVIYNDYLFKEPKHCYWKLLAQQRDWMKSFLWILPLKRAQEELMHVNTSIKSEVVGHPSIDACISATLVENKSEVFRQQLGVDKLSSLIFISGTKELSADQALLDELLSSRSEGGFENVIIRFGLHPGVMDLTAYVRGLSTHVLKVNANVVKFLKFVVNERIKPRIQLNQLEAELICDADVNGDQCALAADGVACSVPATLATTSAMAGKPAYNANAENLSYLPGDRMFVGRQNIGLFFKSVSSKVLKGTITKGDLGLPIPSAVTLLSGYLK